MNSNLSPNYSFVFSFEQNFDYKPRAKWFQKNWTKSFYLTLIYLFLVFGIKHLMKNRKPFQLRVSLVVWNLILAVFSILGSIRTIPELIHVLNNFGFEFSVCSNSYHREVPVSSFWTFLFIVSKAPELIDTLFVVLRKQRLIFLHWYHHVTVLLFTWMCYADESSAGRWYIDMNYVVHALMYSYYCLRALKVAVPRQVAMVITSSQIVQMLVGTYVTVYALQTKMGPNGCGLSFNVIYAGILMYFSYFVLFANFFKKSYLKPKKSE